MCELTSMGELAQDNRSICLDGKRLAQARRSRAISQEQLAALSAGPHPVSLATIKRAERGVPVYLETARRLAELLETPLSAIWTAESSARSDLATHAESRPPSDVSRVGVAVLPFRTAAGDELSLNLAQGLVEDLTTRLSGFWFPVICRASTLGYTSATEVSLVASDLHIGYVIAGSVRRAPADGLVRIQCRLIEAKTDVQLWAGEYNRPYQQLFALQDQVTADIVESVRDKLLLRESRRLDNQANDDLEAWELTVRGAHLFYQRTPESNRHARQLFHSALQRDHSAAWSAYLLAMTHQQDLLNQWSQNPVESLRGLGEVASEFSRRHPSDPRAFLVNAYVDVYSGRGAAARDHLLRSLDGAPNQHLSYSLLGQLLAMADQPDDAIEQFEIAHRLSPRDVDLWSLRTATGLAHFVADRLDEALNWAESAVSVRPDLAFAFGAVASISALLGDMPKATAAVAMIQHLNPQMNIARFAPLVASTHPRIAQRYLEGLKLAGLP